MDFFILIALQQAHHVSSGVQAMEFGISGDRDLV